VVTACVAELQVNIGYHASELLGAASECMNNGEKIRPTLWDALFAVAGSRNGGLDPRALGR
jgi:hypothetical protein